MCVEHVSLLTFDPWPGNYQCMYNKNTRCSLLILNSNVYNLFQEIGITSKPFCVWNLPVNWPGLWPLTWFMLSLVYAQYKFKMLLSNIHIYGYKLFYEIGTTYNFFLCVEHIHWMTFDLAIISVCTFKEIGITMNFSDF